MIIAGVIVRRAAAFIFADVYPRGNDDADRRPMIIAGVIVRDDTTLALAPFEKFT
jgi:hypothetical protein